MRKLLSILVLVLIGAGVWFAARWFVHRGEVRATILFSNARSLRRGAPVVENGTVVGKVIGVSTVDERQAVTVRLSAEHRRAIVTDSLFDVEQGELIVTNTFATGRPIDNGAVIEAPEDQISRWLAKHASAASPVLDKLRARADEVIDRDFASWTAKLPDWKNEGAVSFALHLAEAKRKVDKIERDLRSSGRESEAQKLRQSFGEWLAKAKQ